MYDDGGNSVVNGLVNDKSQYFSVQVVSDNKTMILDGRN